jgi:hypothetical protein
MATEIAKSQGSLGSRLINTQMTDSMDSMMGIETLSSIGATVNKSSKTLEKSNTAVLNIVSSLVNEDKYASITTELKSITKILRFIRSKQLTRMLTMMSPKGDLKAAGLNKMALADDAHDDKAAIRKAREDKLEAGIPKGEGEEKQDVPKEFAFKKGGLFYAIAIALGAAAGVIHGQIVAIKTFAKLLTPKWVKMKLSGAMKSISTSFTKAFTSFKNMFTSLKDSKVGKILTKVKTAMKAFFKPFTVLAKMIGPAVKSFGGIAAKMAPLVSKIFAPIAIIMGVVDAVKGAMAGYEKGGIGGMVFGAIQGLMNSLVMKPLDLLKDLVSWVAEKLGFENFSKALDSFSFENMFTDLTDKLINLSAEFNNKLKQIVKGLLPDADSFLAKFIPDSVYEWADGYKPPEVVVQSKQDKAMQNNAESLLDTPKKKLFTVKKYKPSSAIEKTPLTDSPAMTATTHNKKIKSESEALKEQSKAIQVNAPQVMNDNSAQTINNLTADAARTPNSRK